MNNGVAKIRMPTRDGRPRVCAPEPKINRATADRNQLFGRYEVRFRADATDGYKLAWRLWPKSGVWPRDGEIDFPEGDLVGSIGPFMHRQNGTTGNDQDPYRTSTKFRTGTRQSSSGSRIAASSSSTARPSVTPPAECLILRCTGSCSRRPS